MTENKFARVLGTRPRPALVPATPPQVNMEAGTYVVDVGPLRLRFREVRSDRELHADVAASYRMGQNEYRHLCRSGLTLGFTGRGTLAKTIAQRLRIGAKTDEYNDLLDAVFDAVEEVLVAEERIGGTVDLRSAALTLPRGGRHVVAPVWPLGPTLLIAPGKAGKSTIARALAVSLASGEQVIPGMNPVSEPRPVLYVAAEDSVVLSHARSVEALCAGVGITRATLAQPIELFDTQGRPLHRLRTAIAERAARTGAVVVLDSQQALLPGVDGNGGIRDRDTEFWQAVEQLRTPVLVIAHPNRQDSRNWNDADGRMAGTEVNRDRARMAWKTEWADEPPYADVRVRRYTLRNTTNNDGPTEAPLPFTLTWQLGYGENPGVATFTARDVDASPPEAAPVYKPARISKEMSAALAAYEAGATKPAAMALALGILPDTAKSRIRLLRRRGLLSGNPVTEDDE